MTDVTWEIVDTNNIQPKQADGGSGKSIVPNGTASIGLDSDPWEELFINKGAKINRSMINDIIAFIVYGYSGSDEQVLIGASTYTHRVYLACAAMMSTDSDARTIMAQESTTADIAVASFKQRDEDAPFLDFDGSEASDASTNISTGNGNGSVVGPKAKNTASM